MNAAVGGGWGVRYSNTYKEKEVVGAGAAGMTGIQNFKKRLKTESSKSCHSLTAAIFCLTVSFDKLEVAQPGRQAPSVASTLSCYELTFQHGTGMEMRL